MRSSLWLKLMGFLLTIVGGGVIIVLVAINLTTVTQFRRFVLSSDVVQARELSAVLSHYYARHGTWEGVESVLEREATGTVTAGVWGWGHDGAWHDGARYDAGCQGGWMRCPSGCSSGTRR